MGKNNILITGLLLLAWLVISCQLIAQEHTDKQTKKLKFATSNKVFILKNIFGEIKIEGSSDSNGELFVEQKITADSEVDYELAKKELELKIEYFGDTVLVYVSSPDMELRRKGSKIEYQMDHWDKGYQFQYNFTAQVPRNAQVIASTVNDGDIIINGIEGDLKANNVNGSIQIKNAMKSVLAVTVNGEINVEFSNDPEKDCEFKTINGNIKVLCSKNLSADVTYKSMNGDFYSNYELASIAAENVKEKKKKGSSTYYKLGNKPQFRIGSGKVKMSFETLNGDMIIKYK
ncbi:MAG: hypothetical protein P1P88_22415 [Bacteroidales bacterium]|nr:hypothetical protein [Bacteroidales bacterium]